MIFVKMVPTRLRVIHLLVKKKKNLISLGHACFGQLMSKGYGVVGGNKKPQPLSPQIKGNTYSTGIFISLHSFLYS